MSRKVNFKEWVYCDPTSKTGLRWLSDGGKGVNRHYKDAEAGSVQGKQAYRIGLGGSAFKVHRVVYEMNFGEIPKSLVVDHIDGNPFNNDISNLRLVTRKVNSRNMKMYVNNKTGITGVQIDEKQPGLLYAVATWRDEKSKKKSKYFSFNKFGEDLAIFLAAEYRSHMIYLMNKSGAGYTNDHGVRKLVPNHVKRG